MDWVKDVAASRAGDHGARARLVEYVTPFVHGVALAHASHQVVAHAMPRFLEAALAAIRQLVDDADAVVVSVREARRLAKDAGKRAQLSTAVPSEAHRALERLRGVSESAREWLLLRLVEGISGAELAETLRLEPAALRKELERSVAEAARLFAQPVDSAGDRWLWEYAGTPSPFVARLELVLPSLRHEVVVSDTPFDDATHVDLAPMALSPPSEFTQSKNPTWPASELPVEARRAFGLPAPLPPQTPGVRRSSDAVGRQIPPLPSLVVDPTLPPLETEHQRARWASGRGAEDDPDRTALQPLELATRIVYPPTDSERTRSGEEDLTQRPAGDAKRTQPRRPRPRPIEEVDRTAPQPFVLRGQSSEETRIGRLAPFSRHPELGRTTLLFLVALVAIGAAIALLTR